MKNKKIIAALTIITSINLPFFAKDTTAAKNLEINSDIQTAIELHDKTRVENNMVYAERACKLLEPYIKENAVATAYYGSVQTLIAGIVSGKNPIKALEYLQLGGEYLDDAVEMASESAEIHLIRLENGIEVSRNSPINRYSVIKKDVNWFLDDDKILSLDDEIKAEAYLYCGHYMLDSGDLDYALELFEECVSVKPESNFAKMANKMLDKYTE